MLLIVLSRERDALVASGRSDGGQMENRRVVLKNAQVDGVSG